MHATSNGSAKWVTHHLGAVGESGKAFPQTTGGFSEPFGEPAMPNIWGNTAISKFQIRDTLAEMLMAKQLETF